MLQNYEILKIYYIWYNNLIEVFFMENSSTMSERVLLVGLDFKRNDEDVEASMKELAELAQAAGANVISSMVQQKAREDPATYVGSGKAEEIYAYCEELDIDAVIFNNELSGSQTRNLEAVINRKVIDRTNLILDIFAQRATTNEGKLQVKLAQLKYRLPRLVGHSDYLSRTGGGIGTRGPGEQKLETDRRHIEREIKNIEDKLKLVEKNRTILRARRENKNIPIVALTGYTNSGKSTLMNSLIKSAGEEEEREVFVKDMLFATLGTSLRRSRFNNGSEFLLIDTVGFVSKLPTRLIEAFKSTLEEIIFADVIVHVVDISNEEVELQINTTNTLMKDLGVINKAMIYAFNKIDRINIDDIEYNYTKYEPNIFISALNGTNLSELLDLIYENLPFRYHSVRMLFGFNEQSELNYFIEKYNIKSVEYKENGAEISADIDEKDYKKYNSNVIGELNV